MGGGTHGYNFFTEHAVGTLLDMASSAERTRAYRARMNEQTTTVACVQVSTKSRQGS